MRYGLCYSQHIQKILKGSVLLIIQLPVANIKTNTHRGRPQIKIALLADGRPRITGLAVKNTNYFSNITGHIADT